MSSTGVKFLLISSVEIYWVASSYFLTSIERERWPEIIRMFSPPKSLWSYGSRSPLYLLAFISRVMTLERGDVILTGTPPGVGPLKAGDKVMVRGEGAGELIHSVIS